MARAPWEVLQQRVTYALKEFRKASGKEAERLMCQAQDLIAEAIGKKPSGGSDRGTTKNP